MSLGKTAVSFDDIIQAEDRLRRKNEALAKDIFGRGRKSNLTSFQSHKSNIKPTFASRVGIAKPSQRSSSSTSNKTNVEAAWVHDLHRARGAPASRAPQRESQPARIKQKELLYVARNGSSHADSMAVESEEINIRGLAGPCVVVGSNFAPGTTAADIESAMVPSGGEMQSCKIVSYSPILVAEMVFAERANAENVIATFNNKKADGRLLSVYMKQERSTAAITSPSQSATNESRAPRTDSIHPDPPPPELSHQESLHSESIRSETTALDHARSGAYDHQREQSDLNRRRAEPEIQDGSYGFESRDERMDVDLDNRRDTWRNAQPENERPRNVARARDDRRLYSDDLYPRPRGRGYR